MQGKKAVGRLKSNRAIQECLEEAMIKSSQQLLNVNCRLQFWNIRMNHTAGKLLNWLTIMRVVEPEYNNKRVRKSEQSNITSSN